MIIIDNIKSLYNRLNKIDYHKYIAFNELAFGAQIGEKTYAFCPFCLQILEFDSSQIDGSRDHERIRLREPVDCGCRKGLRYIRRGLLEETLPESRYLGLRLKYAGLCAIIMIGSIIGFYAGVRYNEAVGIHNDALAYLVLYQPLVMAAAFTGMLVALIRQPKKYRADMGTREESDDPFLTVRTQLREKEEQHRAEESRKGRPDEKEPPTWGYGLQGHTAWERPGAWAGTGTMQSAYIPDDFEPGMDPYDREALYHEEMLDDWIIAGGGDPFDFDTRMSAISDPFDFGGDGFGGGDE